MPADGRWDLTGFLKGSCKFSSQPLSFDRELTRVGKLRGKNCMKAYCNDNKLTGMTEGLSKEILAPS